MEQNKRSCCPSVVHLLSFPNEVLTCILELLDPDDVLSVMATCKRLHRTTCWMRGYWTKHTGGNPRLDLAITNSSWSGLYGHFLFARLRSAELFGPAPQAGSHKFYRNQLAKLTNPNAPITVFVVSLLRVYTTALHGNMPMELTRMTTIQTATFKTPKCCTEDIAVVEIVAEYAHKFKPCFFKWMLTLEHRCTKHCAAPGIRAILTLKSENYKVHKYSAEHRGDLWETLRLFASMDARCPRHIGHMHGKSCTNACKHLSDDNEYTRLLRKFVESQR